MGRSSCDPKFLLGRLRGAVVSDLTAQPQRGVLSNHGNDISTLAFRPDGASLISGSKRETPAERNEQHPLRGWDAKSLLQRDPSAPLQ
jgi:hypothetical protein